MKALEAIATSQWSNIPSCIVQSINILVEASRNSGLVIENLKSQVFDLNSKISVKTQKFEEGLEELQTSFAKNKASVSEKLKDLETGIFSSNEAADKISKAGSSQYNEIKAKLNHLGIELKKQNKDVNNKIEKITEEIQNSIEEERDRFNTRIEEDLKKINSKFLNFIQDLEESLRKSNSKQEGLSQKTEEIQEKMKVMSICLELNEKTMKSANEVLSKVVFRSKKTKTSIKDLSRRIEKIFNNPVSPLSSPRSEPGFTIDLNPVSSKIEDLGKKIMKLETDLKASLEKAVITSNQETLKLETKIKSWTFSEIKQNIESFLGETKKKLEWIPNGCESIKTMTVTEARMFLLESRIRQEETNRITSIQEIENQLKAVKPEVQRRKSKSIHNADEKLLIKAKPPNKRPSSSFARTGLIDKFRYKITDLIL